MPTTQQRLVQLDFSRRGFLAAAGAAAAGVTLAACAPSSTKAGVTTLSVWTNSSAEEAADIQKVITAFEKSQSSVKAKLLNIADGNQFYTKLKTAAVGNKLPDVFIARTFDTGPFADKGWTRALDDLVKRDSKEVDPDDFWPAETAQLSYKDKRYALPYDFSNIAIYINKTMFEEAGVDIPDGSWTWDEYYATAAKFAKKENGKRTRWGTTLLTADWYMLGVFASNGGSVFSDDLSKCVIDSPENVDTLKQLIAAMDSGAAPLPNATPAGVDPFTGGLTAMYIMGSFATTSMREAIGDKFDWDVVALPKGSSGTRSVTCAGAGWSIASSTQNVDQAWDLVKYLASPAGEKTMIVDPTRSVPGRQSSAKQWAEVAAASNEPPEHIDVFYTQMKDDAIDIQYPTYYQDFQTIWANQIATLGAGGDPKTILANVQDQTNKTIARS